MAQSKREPHARSRSALFLTRLTRPKGPHSVRSKIGVTPRAFCASRLKATRTSFSFISSVLFSREHIKQPLGGGDLQNLLIPSSSPQAQCTCLLASSSHPKQAPRQPPRTSLPTASPPTLRPLPMHTLRLYLSSPANRKWPRPIITSTTTRRALTRSMYSTQRAQRPSTPGPCTSRNPSSARLSGPSLYSSWSTSPSSAWHTNASVLGAQTQLMPSLARSAIAQRALEGKGICP
ncbi:hypothetical protein FB45DRAFT_1053366 [Roridomyces roridus]|uniref:Uncharacterized protein n=1 Tax=Roridomyces roridus TaxID=1738132 RepID=A0AAD7FYI8_9AGAR|nr:hypothetical protein FB45DRAFT_1053366 [Roridomyces roridus]